MRMPDHELFEKNLYDISTPEHQDYGKHLNHEEVRASARSIYLNDCILPNSSQKLEGD